MAGIFILYWKKSRFIYTVDMYIHLCSYETRVVETGAVERRTHKDHFNLWLLSNYSFSIWFNIFHLFRFLRTLTLMRWDAVWFPLLAVTITADPERQGFIQIQIEIIHFFRFVSFRLKTKKTINKNVTSWHLCCLMNNVVAVDFPLALSISMCRGIHQ